MFKSDSQRKAVMAQMQQQNQGGTGSVRGGRSMGRKRSKVVIKDERGVYREEGGVASYTKKGQQMPQVMFSTTPYKKRNKTFGDFMRSRSRKASKVASLHQKHVLQQDLGFSQTRAGKQVGKKLAAIPGYGSRRID